MKETHSEALAAARNAMGATQVERLERIAALPDDAINTRDPDAPEVIDRAGAVLGRFYRPSMAASGWE